MKLKKKIKKIILPTLFLLLVAAINLFKFINPEHLPGLRDLLFIVFIGAAFFSLRDLHQQVSIYSKVKIAVLYLLILYAIYLIFMNISGALDTSDIFRWTAVFSTLYVVVIILIFTIIRDLIFIQRKKATLRNFNIALILILIFSYMMDSQSLNINIQMPSDDSGMLFPSSANSLTIIVVILMIYMIVLNSFRTYWVKYLNRKQKIKTFLLSGIILGLSILIMSKRRSFTEIGDFADANFISAGFIFIIAYFSISMLVILLYLPTAGFLDRKEKELSSLQKQTRSILGVIDLEKVMQIIIEQTIEISSANYCWLIVNNPATNKYELMAEKDLPLALAEKFSGKFDPDFIGWIKKNKTVLMIDRISKDQRTAKIEAWKYRNGSLLGIPLILNEVVTGMLFAVKNIEYGFVADDKTVLSMFANNAALALENARLVEKSLEQEMYEQELKIAHEAQMKLLPSKMPEIKNLEIEASCITANEVGGDYYDFFEFGKSKLGVVIGDVSGKGAEAAFYMAEAKGIIESLSQIYLSPKELLIEANKILFNTLDKKTFISALYGIFDFNNKTFHFCRAGHCPLLYWNNKKEEIYLIEPAGLALGLDSGEYFKKTLVEEQIKFHKNDVMIFYTDGVNEARNVEQDEFEENRLCDVLIENCQSNSTAIKNAILEKIENFVGDQNQHDDLTMVVLKPT